LTTSVSVRHQRLNRCRIAENLRSGNLKSEKKKLITIELTDF
jgi:hypothetical protein